MDVLQKEGIHMKDPKRVENILMELMKGRASQLQVIADFDFTLSRYHKDNKKCDSTFCVLDQPPFCSEEYLKQSNSMLKHYYPIEIDPNISKAEKKPLMIEWALKCSNLLKISNVSKEQIPDMVKASNAQLRDGIEFMCESLNQKSVPLMIFSAGVGDILIELLKQRKILLPNMKIISNFMQFDEKKKLIGFKNNLIHTFNKAEVSLQNSDYFNNNKSRNNIILLGDSLGDIDMAEGLQNVNAFLKIGFLNCKIDGNLASYLDTYDIVLADDQTMDVVNGILKHIL